MGALLRRRDQRVAEGGQRISFFVKSLQVSHRSLNVLRIRHRETQAVEGFGLLSHFLFSNCARPDGLARFHGRLLGLGWHSGSIALTASPLHREGR